MVTLIAFCLAALFIYLGVVRRVPPVVAVVGVVGVLILWWVITGRLDAPELDAVVRLRLAA